MNEFATKLGREKIQPPWAYLQQLICIVAGRCNPATTTLSLRVTAMNEQLIALDAMEEENPTLLEQLLKAGTLKAHLEKVQRHIRSG